jgi:hypothetical protein
MENLPSPPSPPSPGKVREVLHTIDSAIDDALVPVVTAIREGATAVYRHAAVRVGRAAALPA